MLIRENDLGGHSLSPDGRWIAVVQSRRAITLVPVQSGEIREVFAVTPLETLGFNKLAWTADGRGIIVRKSVRGRTAENEPDATGLWLVPIDRSPARKLDIDVRRMAPPPFSGIELHPDGKRLAFTSDGSSRTEVWVLENFLVNTTQPLK